MIIRRPSAPFRVVCLEDPALDGLPFDMLEKYSLERNIDTLDLGRCVDKPTVFTCVPLKARYEHLASDPEPHHLWGIFSRHVTKVEHAGFEVETETVHDETRIKDSMRDAFPPEVVAEVALVIIQAANKDGVSLPFFSPASWQLTRTKRMAMRALRASAKPASGNSSN